MGTSAGPRRPVAQRGGSGSGGAVGRPPVSAGAQAVTDEGTSVGGRRDRRPCPPETRRSPEGIRDAGLAGTEAARTHGHEAPRGGDPQGAGPGAGQRASHAAGVQGFGVGEDTPPGDGCW